MKKWKGGSRPRSADVVIRGHGSLKIRDGELSHKKLESEELSPRMLDILSRVFQNEDRLVIRAFPESVHSYSKEMLNLN